MFEVSRCGSTGHCGGGQAHPRITRRAVEVRHRSWPMWALIHSGCRSRNEHIPKEKPCLILIVRTAAELDIVRRSASPCGVGRDVVELEEAGLAATAHAPDERATSLIALPHRTLDRTAGMWRPAAVPSPPLGRGADAWANLRRSRWSMSRVSARSRSVPISPSGSAWRASACARRSFSCVSRERVTCSL